MHKENLPGYGQQNLYDNLIEYKGSFFNAILINERFPKHKAGTWKEWIADDKSNRVYLTYAFLKDPRHCRRLLRLWYMQNREKIAFPFFVFCYFISDEGKAFAEHAGFARSEKTLWGCRKYGEREFIRLCGLSKANS